MSQPQRKSLSNRLVSRVSQQRRDLDHANAALHTGLEPTGSPIIARQYQSPTTHSLFAHEWFATQVHAVLVSWGIKDPAATEYTEKLQLEGYDSVHMLEHLEQEELSSWHFKKPHVKCIIQR